MDRKLLLGLLATALVAACFGPSTSSAATLYTNSAHTSAVPVGTTFTATIPEPIGANEWGYTIESPQYTPPRCRTGSYTFKVTQNSGGTFKAAITGGTFSGCASPYTLTVYPEGELTVGGSAIAVGTSKAWLSSTLYTHLGGTYNFVGQLTSATGNPPANGVYAQQPAVGAPVKVVLTHAGVLAGGPQFVSYVTAAYLFSGAAAAYSFN